jgi:hypothetical protein
VTDAQTTNDDLRGAAYHEAGHVMVARFLGLTIGKIEIEEDGSGRADTSSAEHLPLIDQVALCVAGMEAQALFNCPTQERVAFSDYGKVCKLVAGLTEEESREIRNSAYLRALEILKGRLPEVQRLAERLIKQRCIDAT